MERLHQDEGLEAVLGYCPPAPETARQWLDKFHDEELMKERPRQGSFIPAESVALAGLKEPSRQAIRTYVDEVKPGWQVTFDVDACLVETAKVNAQYCYQGYRAFQSMEVEWAETGLCEARCLYAKMDDTSNVIDGQAILMNTTKSRLPEDFMQNISEHEFHTIICPGQKILEGG